MRSHFPETRASLLLRLPNASDMLAWEEFVKLYGPCVLRIVTRHGLQAADAENVLQEVLLRVAKSIDLWLNRSDRGRFRPWLLSIAKNETVSLLTRKGTRPFASAGLLQGTSLENLPDPSKELLSAIDLEYEREVFLWAAEQIREIVAPHTWQAFWLSHVDGLPIEEVAKRLGTQPSNIYIARSRVMNRLRQIVQQFEAS
ncbi:RNA polymerase sigma factor [Pirellulaceae bacterium SH449]